VGSASTECATFLFESRVPQLVCFLLHRHIEGVRVFTAGTCVRVELRVLLRAIRKADLAHRRRRRRPARACAPFVRAAPRCSALAAACCSSCLTHAMTSAVASVRGRSRHDANGASVPSARGHSAHRARRRRCPPYLGRRAGRRNRARLGPRALASLAAIAHGAIDRRFCAVLARPWRLTLTRRRLRWRCASFT